MKLDELIEQLIKQQKDVVTIINESEYNKFFCVIGCDSSFDKEFEKYDGKYDGNVWKFSSKFKDSIISYIKRKDCDISFKQLPKSGDSIITQRYGSNKTVGRRGVNLGGRQKFLSKTHIHKDDFIINDQLKTLLIKESDKLKIKNDDEV